MENEYHIINEGIKRVVNRDELEDLNTSGKDAKIDVDFYMTSEQLEKQV